MCRCETIYGCMPEVWGMHCIHKGLKEPVTEFFLKYVVCGNIKYSACSCSESRRKSRRVPTHSLYGAVPIKSAFRSSFAGGVMIMRDKEMMTAYFFRDSGRRIFKFSSDLGETLSSRKASIRIRSERESNVS